MILQISWFIDYMPSWLSDTLVILGLFTALTGTLLNDSLGERIVDNWTKFWLFIMIIAASIEMYGILPMYSSFVMIPVLTLAKYIEGLVAIRFYQKLFYFYKHQSIAPTQSVSISSKIIITLLLFFTILMIGWLLILAILLGYLELGFEKQIQLYWTLATVVISIVGLSMKFWTLEDDFGFLFFIGCILMISGSEIHNLQAVKIEMFVFLLGSVAYSIGYWIFFYKLIKSSHYRH